MGVVHTVPKILGEVFAIYTSVAFLLYLNFVDNGTLG